MLRVTLDANVIVSGFYGSGNPRRILEMGQAGEFRLVVSQPILEEVADVLQRPKFGWSQSEVQLAIEDLLRVADRVEPKQIVDIIKNDPSDNRILECAATARSDYLVSGDKHLLSLGQFGHTKIVNARDFLEIMQARRR